MNNWLLQNYTITLRCSLGLSGNACHGNSQCSQPTSTCCQQGNGCNACVGNKTIFITCSKYNLINYIFYFIVPCPQYPTPRTGCTSGYSAYSSPTGCVSYQCNEDLPTIIAIDNAAVQEALAAVSG